MSSIYHTIWSIYYICLKGLPDRCFHTKLKNSVVSLFVSQNQYGNNLIRLQLKKKVLSKEIFPFITLKLIVWTRGNIGLQRNCSENVINRLTGSQSLSLRGIPKASGVHISKNFYSSAKVLPFFENILIFWKFLFHGSYKKLLEAEVATFLFLCDSSR